MDLVTRKTGRHIETEPDYEGAFTLQIRMMPVYTLVYDWCFSDVSTVKPGDSSEIKVSEKSTVSKKSKNKMVTILA